MKAIKLTDKVWWVGAIDWGLRNFHGYTTSRGSTYNAYLILAEKITLIDTVKAYFMDEMMSRIASVIEPKKISYIISNHTEMDHSGCLTETIKAVEPEGVFASAIGVKGLKEHFSFDRDITAVRDGEVLDLGGMNLTFYETRMLHWPDSMVTYLKEEGILFSQDGFGMHLASNERFDDEVSADILEYEAKKYFANILTPYSDLVLKFANRLAILRLDLKMIAPDHGPVWRKDISKVINWYIKWAEQKPAKKAVIVFDTMWQSTAKMARVIGEGLSETGIDTKVVPIHESNRSDVAVELIDAGALIVGSPTINKQMFPTIADIMCYIKGLKFKNLIGSAFGSYGWSGEAVELVRKGLEEIGVDIIGDELKVKYRPNEEELKKCFDLGKTIGERLSKF